MNVPGATCTPPTLLYRKRVGAPVLERIPTILTAQEILDKAFQRSLKLEVPDPDRYHRIRKTEMARMQSVVDNVSETLARFPDAFPNLDHLRDYEREVLDIIAGLPQLRKSLGSVAWAAQKVKELGQHAAHDWMKCRDVPCFKRIQNRAYGRLSSVVYDVDKDLTFLAEVRAKAKVLPEVHPGFATVVIAGFPNVGKSSLLAAWTKARPEIAAYAFTTKKAEVGHFDVQRTGQPTRVQIVDTPGLLDRRDEERNEIERQAVAALRHAADAVIFLLDPTETSGYSLKEQEALLAQVLQEMSGIPMVVAETKADVWQSGSDRLRFSTVTGEGLDQLRDRVTALLPDESELEEDPLDRWRTSE